MSNVYDNYLPPNADGVFLNVGGAPGGGDQWADQNRGVVPLFYQEPVLNEGQTAEQGRPIFTPEERCMIIVQGDQFTRTVHPVDSYIKERFAEAYRRWQLDKKERFVEGTPLRAWPLLSVAQVAEFEALSIHTVEGVANLADQNLGRSMDLRAWREKAKVWLAQAKDGALAVKLQGENDVLRSDMAELRDQIAKLATELAAATGKDVKLNRAK